jgi:hypothetical protein
VVADYPCRGYLSACFAYFPCLPMRFVPWLFYNCHAVYIGGREWRLSLLGRRICTIWENILGRSFLEHASFLPPCRVACDRRLSRRSWLCRLLGMGYAMLENAKPPGVLDLATWEASVILLRHYYYNPLVTTLPLYYCYPWLHLIVFASLFGFITA